MGSYNSLSDIEIDLEAIGVCVKCGRRLTDEICEHATQEQLAIQYAAEQILANELAAAKMVEVLEAAIKQDPEWAEIQETLRYVPDAATLMENEIRSVNSADDLPFPIGAVGGC